MATMDFNHSKLGVLPEGWPTSSGKPTLVRLRKHRPEANERFQDAGGFQALLADLKVCSRTHNLPRGKQVHAEAAACGQDANFYVASALINMYAKCGCMVHARQIFNSMKQPNVVPWNVLIFGYAENGQASLALDLFNRMLHRGPAPTHVTFLAALKACISHAVKGGSSVWEECRERGEQIYELAVKNGHGSEARVQNTLMDLYTKCGSMVEARQFFESMKCPDVVSFNVLILGYADNGQGLTALDLFMKMRSKGPAPNPVTFAAVIKACGLVGGLEFGRKIHWELQRPDFDVVLVSCLVDFYAKCGSLVEAQSVFDQHAGMRNTITWTALLEGFSSCGDHESVFKLFGRMTDEGFRPDSITFLSILSCCSHAGLVDKGKECFDGMLSKCGVAPTVEHYTCMLDILGRANQLDEAMALMSRMPHGGNYVTWMTILDACRRWKNVEVGWLAFQSSVTINEDASAYMLMGQIYGSRGMLKEQEMVMGMRRKFTVWRKPVETCWTNELGEVHTFLVEALGECVERGWYQH